MLEVTMRSRPVFVPSRSRFLAGLALLPLLALLHSAPTDAAFHLNEITKIMVGLNGNTTIQAVELKMLTINENLVDGISIKVYDAAGTQVDSLGSFSGPVPNGATGRSILCATPNFAATFGIEPDLLIKPGLLVGTGQVSFEKPGCLVNAIAYGAVTTPKNGATSAPALPADAATALSRTIDDPQVPSCPLSEDAAARFQIVSGTPGSPIIFRNNFGDFVQVHPTATGVGEGASRPVSLRVYPNPFNRGAKIVAPGYGYLAVYDVQGRQVRSWGSLGVMPRVMGPMSLQWDGTDALGRHLPSGIYFVQYGLTPEHRARVVLLR
jgi:hypothetical protein